MTKISAVLPETRDAARVVELAQRAEDVGLHGLWLGSAFGFDPVMALANAGTQTSRVLLGTSVVPTWTRHPVVMAQQAATANALSRGRFRLGVGPSHVPVMKMLGIEWDRPLGHVREYLTVLRALLHEGNVAFKGERYRVKAFLDVASPGPPPVMLAALHEGMCRLAGELSDGVLPWLVPPAYVASAIVPKVAEGAALASRAAPPIIASVPCVISADRDEVRVIAHTELAIYPRMPFYADGLVLAGVPDAERAMTDGWTDSMIDAVIPWGDADAIGARVAAYVAAGVDEVVLSPFGGQGDLKALEVLGDIARG
jgi:F420-dependent oxidoreductase-like protein